MASIHAALFVPWLSAAEQKKLRKTRLRRAKLRPRRLFMLSWVLLVAGCGSSSTPTTIPVRGTVTWQGGPLDSGTVVFHRVDVAQGEFRRNATAQLGPDGTFQMSTFSVGDGVMPGRYSVSVQSYTEGNAIDFIDASNVPKTRIPQRYTSPQTSGLSAEIPAGERGPLEFHFDLQE